MKVDISLSVSILLQYSVLWHFWSTHTLKQYFPYYRHQAVIWHMFQSYQKQHLLHGIGKDKVPLCGSSKLAQSTFLKIFHMIANEVDPGPDIFSEHVEI